jgi:poly(3-hydroxybutyrate) depolymerase
MLAAMLFVWTLTWSQIAAAAGPTITIAPGAGSFSFVDEQGDPSRQITVYTYLPERLKPSAAPIVFVMHGHGKNAKGYRDTWIEHADKYQFMVVAPLFDKEQWGGADYSYASVVAKDGKLQAASMWSFNLIEHLFDLIKRSTGNQNSTYFIYGHSEGGQFVHRLVLFLPEARYARAVAANPGWYTMPTFDVKFPYGLDGSPATEASLKKSLGREFVLMLGDRDTDPNHKDLRKTPEAMAQGVNRFERGQDYFKEARQRAAELKCTLGWHIQVVPGVAHQNSEMSGPAAAVLMGADSPGRRRLRRVNHGCHRSRYKHRVVLKR